MNDLLQEELSMLISLSSVGMEKIKLLLLYHEPEHNQNQIQGQSSLVNIEGLERHQMCELNFNVNTGLYYCPTNRAVLTQLGEHVLACRDRVQTRKTPEIAI